MTDKEYRTVCKKLLQLHNKWRNTLGLRHWTVKMRVVRERADNLGPDDDVLGRASVSWEYQQATLTFFAPGLVTQDDRALEEIFVHECCHILVHEMREFALGELTGSEAKQVMRHEERVVTQLTNALLWSYDMGKKEAKTARKPKKKAVK